MCYVNTLGEKTGTCGGTPISADLRARATARVAPTIQRISLSGPYMVGAPLAGALVGRLKSALMGQQPLGGVWGVPTFSLLSRRRREKALLRSPDQNLHKIDNHSRSYYTAAEQIVVPFCICAFAIEEER